MGYSCLQIFEHGRALHFLGTSSPNKVTLFLGGRSLPESRLPEPLLVHFGHSEQHSEQISAFQRCQKLD